MDTTARSEVKFCRALNVHVVSSHDGVERQGNVYKFRIVALKQMVTLSSFRRTLVVDVDPGGLVFVGSAQRQP